MFVGKQKYERTVLPRKMKLVQMNLIVLFDYENKYGIIIKIKMIPRWKKERKDYLRVW